MHNDNSNDESTDEEDWRYINKPYQCPVRGCPKRYKNSNGVKYHRLHAHQNDVLVAHTDGTFSLVTGKSQADIELEEKEAKPYLCAHCGKRYKNYNGLKYHRKHSVPCGSQPASSGSILIDTP